jgi:hypothetical protein
MAESGSTGISGEGTDAIGFPLDPEGFTRGGRFRGAYLPSGWLIAQT